MASVTGHRTLACLVLLAVLGLMSRAADKKPLKPEFHTSDRCLACHNGLKTPTGEDVSIGFAWRSSIMGNSARDPYWQASVRREDIDHPEARGEIEDGCADCHMPIARYEAKLQGRLGEVFAHLPFDRDPKKSAVAEDGVSCSLCHQIGKEKLGTRESFNGGFVVDPPQGKDDHSEYGPFAIQDGQARHHADFDRRISSRRGCPAYSGFGHVRYLPHALHEVPGTGWETDRNFSGTDALPGVAAQRLSGQVKLPVVSHAGSSGRCADCSGSRRCCGPVCGSTLLLGQIFSCCEC